MKKPKIVAPFYFKDLSNSEVLDIINKEYPVNIKYNEDLVNRVHARYPFISKTETSIIVKAFFQSLRDMLILGKILNFNKLFFDVKFHFFDYRKNGHIFPWLKVKISTPPKLRNYDE